MNLPQIVRTKKIRGFSFSGIIRNSNYYHTSLEVFSDGLIYCWEMVDLELFKEKLAAKWVVTSVPEEEPLCIHGIGNIHFDDASWTHTPESLYDFIDGLIDELNPRRENLHDCHGKTTVKVGKANNAALSHGAPKAWKPDGAINPFLTGEQGTQVLHFRVEDKQLHLVRISLFPDDTVHVSGLPSGTKNDSIADFRKQLDDRTWYRLPESGERVSISQLGSFTARDWVYRVDLKELAAEIEDEYQQVLGKPGAVKACYTAYQKYLETQTIENLKALKTAYEAVPQHLRMYCGDMDTKDIPIRMILYGKDEIERWSHYQVAKQEGETLPNIEIPPPPEN